MIDPSGLQSRERVTRHSLHSAYVLSKKSIVYVFGDQDDHIRNPSRRAIIRCLVRVRHFFLTWMPLGSVQLLLRQHQLQ
jgi:hypothetical protein